MGFEFHENVVLTVPDFKTQYSPFRESATHRENNKLIVEIAAIHAGLTSNFNMYTETALEGSLASWVNPYPRPVILNHDTESDTIGRIMASKLMTEADGTHYVRLQAAITDPLAIERVLDERYLTGSVGGAAKSAKCSVCDTDWAAAEMSGQKSLPCRHRRGSVYEGKLAYFELGDLKFKEYSFVNVPADEQSGVRAKALDAAAQEGADGGWAHTVKMYSLNMNSPAVVEMSESEGHDLLTGMPKKEAKSTYMNLKGTFLSVSAYDYRENEEEIGNSTVTPNTIINDLVTKKDMKTSSQFDENSKENKMAKDAVELKDEENDDILGVVTELANDLAPVESDEDPADESLEDDEKESDEETSEESDEPSANADPEADPEDEEEDTEEKEVEAATEEEEQLVDSDESDEEPEVDPEDDEEDVEPATEAEVTSEEAKPEGQENGETDLKDDPTRNISDVEEENKKLKQAMKMMLAEKVVDAKIARGLADPTDKATLVEEHAKRTASSLGDSLKDLAKTPVKAATDVVVPRVEEQGLVADEDNVVNETESDAEPDPRETVTHKTLMENLMYGMMNNKIKYQSAE